MVLWGGSAFSQCPRDTFLTGMRMERFQFLIVPRMSALNLAALSACRQHLDFD
jgi:hypothetical protein